MEEYPDSEFNDHDFAAKSWERLGHHAEHGVRGTGAIVEALRRVDESTDKLMQVSNRLSIRANWLAAAMLVLAIVEIGMAIWRGR